VSHTVRRLTADDAEAYRTLRLEGLVAEPSAFGASLEEDAAHSLSSWRERLDSGFTFGVFDGDELGGLAGYYTETGSKTRHRGHVFGVYLRPAFRGTGAATQLLEAVIASARQHVRFLYLQVTQNNARAVRFYERMGFSIYGNDPGGLLVDGTMYQDYLMLLRLDEGSGK
jgi:ribosomal protein S18 acetylase RimI-like enzyme